MQINRDHRSWALATLTASLLALLVYAMFSAGAPKGPSGGTWVGLGFGFGAFLCMTVDWLLGLRKRFRTLRVGSAQLWLKMHIWLGLLSLSLVWFHSGFGLGGGLTTTVMTFYYAVMLSGLLGLALQQFVPARMMQRVPLEAVHAQLDHVLDGLAVEAYEQVASVVGPLEQATREIQLLEEEEAESKRVTGSWKARTRQRIPEEPLPGSEILRDFYLREVRPYLRNLNAQVGFPDFRPVVLTAPDEWRIKIERLQFLCEEARQLAVQRRLHRLMHGWLLVHVPLSFALLALVLLHAFHALRY